MLKSNKFIPGCKTLCKTRLTIYILFIAFLILVFPFQGEDKLFGSILLHFHKMTLVVTKVNTLLTSENLALQMESNLIQQLFILLCLHLFQTNSIKALVFIQVVKNYVLQTKCY